VLLHRIGRVAGASLRDILALRKLGTE